jgi:hypothetical protein
MSGRSRTCARAATRRQRRHTGRGRRPSSQARHGRSFDFFDAVDGEETETPFEGARNVPLLLDGVAEGNAGRVGAGCQHHFDFADRGAVKGRTEAFQEVQDFRSRVGLHRVEDGRVRQGRAKGFESCRGQCRDRQQRRGRLRRVGAGSRGYVRSWGLPLSNVTAAPLLGVGAQFHVAGCRTGKGRLPRDGTGGRTRTCAATVGQCSANVTRCAKLSRVGNAVDWIGRNRTARRAMM